MKKDTHHIFLVSLVCAAVCIGIFVWSTFSIMRQGLHASSALGDIYINAVNLQMQRHFHSIIDLKLEQVAGIISGTPPESVKTYGTAMRRRLAAGAIPQNFTYLALYDTEGNEDVIVGKPIIPEQMSARELFLRELNDGNAHVTSAVTTSGQSLLLMAVPVGYPSSRGYPMRNGGVCTALVAGIPLEYIRHALSMYLDETQLFSQIIRTDGSFVLRDNSVKENNCYDWIRKQGRFDGKTAESMIASMQKNLLENKEYSMFMNIGGQRFYMHSSPLPHSQWYLVTMMPQGSFDTVVSKLWSQRLYTAVGAGLLLPLPILALLFFYTRFAKRQIEELKKARDEADRANRAKSDFLSNMSHDIRTPMNAIVGMTAIASSNPGNTAIVRDCLSKIALASRHLLGLINNVLDMSKIEHGKLSLNISPVSLRDIMDEMVGVVQPLVKARRQHFGISIRNILTENVYSDGVRLGQVMLNLLSNAIKFTPADGNIQVRLYQEPSPRGEDYVRTHIEVQDSGKGMSPEFQKKIYEAFSREEDSSVQRIEGTGLGMSIMKYLVDEMGGTIALQSELDKGTCFHITLDMRKVQETQEPLKLPHWNALVVDDDEELCRSAAASLEEMGVCAQWALNGSTAVDMAKKHHEQGQDYHVMLLDWQMPGMNGVETALQLRRVLGDEVPVLLMSAYDWSEVEEDARRAGITGFIAKPLFKSTLYHGLKSLDGGPSADPAGNGAPQWEGRRILLAEDNELNWEITSTLLRRQGFTLDWAENGRRCVDMFRASAYGYYDLVLMDVRMPEMDGYQATRAIRAMNRPDAHVPIIAMTADAFSDDIALCLKNGMDAHITKPMDMKLLLSLLQRHLCATPAHNAPQQQATGSRHAASAAPHADRSACRG